MTPATQAWFETRKTEYPRSKRIVIKNQDAHSGYPQRRVNFLLYVPFNTVGAFCDAFRVLYDAGLTNNGPRGMGHIHWDVMQGHIELV